MARYDEIAEWYAGLFGARIDDPPTLATLEALGDVAGKSVCDLACGHGRVSRDLARRGASVVGVDLSERLIAIAREHERDDPLGVTYICDDVSSLEGDFDSIVCNLALADIDDLDGALRAVAASLRPSGRFVATLPHPCFQGPKAQYLDARDDLPAGRFVAGYFDEGRWMSSEPAGVRGKVGATHRMLSTYLNAIVGSGMVLERLVEPRPPGPYVNPAVPIPGYDQVPTVIVLIAVVT